MTDLAINPPAARSVGGTAPAKHEDIMQAKTAAKRDIQVPYEEIACAHEHMLRLAASA